MPSAPLPFVQYPGAAAKYPGVAWVVGEACVLFPSAIHSRRSQASFVMEDSYTVHRRRKAAARNREKTPEPPRLEVDNNEDDGAREKMERMVADTEQMEESGKQGGDVVLPVDPEPKATKRSTLSVRRASRLEEVPKDDGSEADFPGKASLNVEGPSMNSLPLEDILVPSGPTSKEEAQEDSLIASKDQGSSQGSSIRQEVPEDVPEPSSNLVGPEEVVPRERPGHEANVASGQDDGKLVKKRSKERTTYTTDSSDNEERSEQSLRRKKSPAGPRTKAGAGKRTKSRSRPPTDTDEDVNTSRNESSREKRFSSKKKPSPDDEDASSPRKNESFGDKSKSRDEDARMRMKLREKRSSRSQGHPSDADEDARMKKSESFPQRSFEKQTIKRSASEMQKQIIPLSDDSLIQDFAKAQKDYLRRERGILDPDSLDDSNSNTEKPSVRRRKLSVDHSESEKEEIMRTVVLQKKSWLSWLPFFPKKEKVDDPSPDVEPKKSPKAPAKIEVATDKVSFMEFLGALKQIVSEFKAFVEQNPRETQLLSKLRNRCIAELLLIIIYCGLGAFIFRFTEGAFETFYKCGVKRVKRDFLDTLWNYSHNMREDDWKSMARRKLMEFEEQLHTAHEAGVHSYSGQRSWTFLNAVVYCLTVVTTIGYGHISPSTTTGRALTIVYAIFGIPIFLIILADFGKLFTRGIKFLWAFVRRLYYTGSCRKVRKTARVQEVMKGVQLVYDFATFRRPSQMNPEDLEEIQKQQAQTVLNLDGSMTDTPGTPAMSNFAIDDEFNLPISVAIFILLGYIFIGAFVYNIWEDWGFFESFYFVFISMSTIGFGDYVPKHPMYMMCSIVYLVFGLALTSMCINVVQVMLSDSFRQASQKIGATIGFEVIENDGTVQPAVPPAVEIAEVHTSVKESESKEKVAPRAKQEDVDL